MSVYRSVIEQARGRKALLASQLAELTARREELLTRRDEALIPAQALVQEVAAATQSQIRIRIERIVQLALDAVFPSRGYTFSLSFETKRGRTEAKMRLLQDGIEMSPTDANGGGVVDVLALALRVSVHSLSSTRPLIFLDEPLKNVSVDLQEKAAMILKRISEELGVQFLIVTHSEQLIASADRVYRTRIEDKRTRVEVEE